MRNTLLPIIPALLCFSFSIIFLINNVLNKNRKGILLGTIIFTSSGFIGQKLIELIIEKAEHIKNFSDKYHNIFSFPLVTIIATTVGIFFGNSILRAFLNSKERKEISILITKSIDLQIINLGFIELNISPEPTIDNTDNIEIYRSEFDDDEPFQVALKRIGIYTENQIDLISDYYVDLRQCLNYIKRYLLESKKQNPSLNTIYKILETSLTFTRLTGILATYIFSTTYSSNNKEELSSCFVKDSYEIIQNYVDLFNYPSFYISKTKFSEDIINRLCKTREVFKKHSYLLATLDQNPIYLCRVSLKENYIDTIPGQNRPIVYIQEDDDIIAFGNSEEESKEKCKILIRDTLQSLLSNLEIDDLIQKQQFQSYIISPWG